MAFWAESALLVGDLWASTYSPFAKAAIVGPLEPTCWSGLRGHFVGCLHTVATQVPEPGFSPLPLPLEAL